MARKESVRQSLPLLGLRHLFDERQLKESRHIVQNAHRLRDVRIVRCSHRLETHPTETIDRILKRQAVLKCNAESPAKTLNKPGQRGALLAHLDEDLSRRAIFMQADGEISLMPRHRKLMRDRLSGSRENTTWIVSHFRGYQLVILVQAEPVSTRRAA